MTREKGQSQWPRWRSVAIRPSCGFITKLIEFSNEPIWHVKERRGIRNDFKILVLSVLQLSVSLCPRAFPERLKKKKKKATLKISILDLECQRLNCIIKALWNLCINSPAPTSLTWESDVSDSPGLPQTCLYMVCGDLMPSSGLFGHYMHVHKPTPRHMHTHH